MHPPGPYVAQTKSGMARTIFLVTIGSLLILCCLTFLGVGVWLSVVAPFNGAADHIKFTLITVGIPAVLIAARGLWLARIIQAQIAAVRRGRRTLVAINALGITLDGDFAPWSQVEWVMVIPYAIGPQNRRTVGVRAGLRRSARPPYAQHVTAGIPTPVQEMLAVRVSAPGPLIDLGRVVTAVRTYAPEGIELFEEHNGIARPI